MSSRKSSNSNHDSGLTRDDIEIARRRLRLKAAVVYEIIRMEGDEELGRPFVSLWWSGIAAGMSIGFSIVAEGLLKTYLPDAPWTPLIDNLGYTVGFVIVVMAREQLFTENTLTAVLPFLRNTSLRNLGLLMRLWGIVLMANLVGTTIFAAGLASHLFFPEAVQQSFLEMSRHFMELTVAEMFLRGIMAGWLVATVVWLLPTAEHHSLWVIVLITYLIALGDMAHVIAGSVEAMLLVFVGEVTLGHAALAFLLPCLIGNIIGGSALFALLAWAQVQAEL